MKRPRTVLCMKCSRAGVFMCTARYRYVCVATGGSVPGGALSILLEGGPDGGGQAEAGPPAATRDRERGGSAVRTHAWTVIVVVEGGGVSMCCGFVFLILSSVLFSFPFFLLFLSPCSCVVLCACDCSCTCTYVCNVHALAHSVHVHAPGKLGTQYKLRCRVYFREWGGGEASVFCPP